MLICIYIYTHIEMVSIYTYIERKTESAFKKKNLLFSSRGFWHNSQSHNTSKGSSFYQSFVEVWALGDLKDTGLKPILKQN